MELPVLNFKFLPDRCHWGRNSSCLQRQEGGGRGGPWRAPHSLGSGSGSLSVVWSHMPPHFAEPFPNRLHNLAVGSSLGGEAGVHVPLSQEDGRAEKSRHAPKSHSMLVGEQSFQARSDSAPLPGPPGPFSFPVSPLTGTDCLSFANKQMTPDCLFPNVCCLISPPAPTHTHASLRETLHILQNLLRCHLLQEALPDAGCPVGSALIPSSI